MHMPVLNYLAVLVGGVLIFALGGLWYSPVLFAKRWIALQGITEEEARAKGPSPLMFLSVFLCGLLTSFALSVVIHHFLPMNAGRGAAVAALCWLGFAGATSYGTALFSMKPRALWMIDSIYNLVCFVLVGVMLSVWQ